MVGDRGSAVMSDQTKGAFGLFTNELRALLALRERIEVVEGAREAAKAVLDPGVELPEPSPPPDPTELWAEEVFYEFHKDLYSDPTQSLLFWNRLTENNKVPYRRIAKRMVKAATEAVCSLMPSKYSGRGLLAARAIDRVVNGFGDGSQGDPRYMVEKVNLDGDDQEGED